MITAIKARQIVNKKYQKQLKYRIKDIFNKIRKASKDGWCTVIYKIQERGIEIDELYHLVDFLRDDCGYEVIVLDNEFKKYDFILVKDTDKESSVNNYTMPEVNLDIRWA